MEHKFSLRDRLHILQALNPTGHYKELCIIKSLADKLKITDQEEKDFGVKMDREGIKIDKETDKMIELTENEVAAISEAFKALEKEGGLNIGNMDLYARYAL